MEETKEFGLGTSGTTITLDVNNVTHLFAVGEGCHEVSPAHTLAFTLRERLGLTGTKISCDRGACGCCTVQVDGKALLSCMLLTVECEGKKIVTIEGLEDPTSDAVDPLQQSFIDHTAFQCGFCTPGIIMSAKAFLAENPAPAKEEVQEALAGNFCRCNSHYHVVEAVMDFVKKGAVK